MYKYEGFSVGQRIRAYDFAPRLGHRYYAQGTIIEVNREGGNHNCFAHYVIQVEKDTLTAVGTRTVVLVPMETTMDWDGRVRLISEDKQSYIIEISDKQRELIVKTMDMALQPVLSDSEKEEFDVLLDMFKNLPDEEADNPGSLHGFSS